MEGFMIGFIAIYYFCIAMAVLAVIIGIIIFLEKRISDSPEASEARKILTFIVGTGTDLVGLFIVFTIGWIAVTNNSYFLQGNSMTDEMVQRKLIELAFNTFVIFFLGVLVVILGGYMAGRVARRNEVVSGLATSVTLSLAASIMLFVLFTIQHISLAFQLTLIVIVIIIVVGSTALGGYFASVQRKRNEAKLTAKIIAEQE